MRLVSIEPDQDTDQEDQQQLQATAPIKANGFSLVPLDTGARSAEGTSDVNIEGPSTPAAPGNGPMDFISKLGEMLGGAPNPSKLQPNYPPTPVEQGETDPFMAALSGAQGTARDLLSIPAAAINQAGFNMPRAITHAAGYQYPAPNWQIGNPSGVKTNQDYQPTSQVATGASNIAGLVGFAKSPILKALGSLRPFAGGANPFQAAIEKRMLGSSFTPKFLPTLGNVMASGAATGAAYSPDQPLNVPQRISQALGWGATAPLLEMGAPAVARIGGKLIRKIANISPETIQKLREIGAKMVFQPNLSRAEYPTQELRPQVEKMVKNAAINMTPSTLRELGMDNDTVNRLLQMTPQKIKEARDQKFSLGGIMDEAKAELEKKVKYAKRLYSDTIKKIPLSKRLNPTDYQQGLTDALEGMFKPNGKGFRTDLQKSTLHSRKPFMALYKELATQLKANKGTGIDKTQYILLHDHLIRLQQSPDGYISGMATELKSLLEGDAHKFGFGDIAGAKETYKEAMEHKPFLAQKYNSKMIAKELSHEQEIALKELEEYTGKQIIEPAKRTNAVDEFDALLKENSQEPTAFSKKIDSILSRVQKEGLYAGNEKELGQAAEELGRLIGNPEKARAIMRNLTSNRINQQFERPAHVSHYWVNALLRNAAAPAVKGYEKARAGALDLPNRISQFFEKETPTFQKAHQTSEEISASLKKKFANESGFVTLTTKHPDLYKFDPTKPTEITRQGKPVSKFVYNPETKQIVPVPEGQFHSSSRQEAGTEVDEGIRGIVKGNLIYLRPSGSAQLINDAIWGDPLAKQRAWNVMREHQIQVAEVLGRTDPTKKFILAGGGPESDLEHIEDASDIPSDAEKKVDPRFIYQAPKLSAQEKKFLPTFSKLSNEGGATVSIQKGDEPTRGYTYSIRKDLENKTPLREYELDNLIDYVKSNQKELQKPNCYLGLWKDQKTGTIYEDAVKNSPNIETAKKEAAAAKQISIWDVKNRTEIPLGASTDWLIQLQRASNAGGEVSGATSNPTGQRGSDVARGLRKGTEALRNPKSNSVKKLLKNKQL